MLSALSALAPGDPASGSIPPPASVIVVNVPAEPALALADTLPHTSKEPRKAPAAPARPLRAAAPAPPPAEARPRSSRPSAPPRSSFQWSWVAAFVAAFAGVVVTAWVFSIPRGRGGEDGAEPEIAASLPQPMASGSASASVSPSSALPGIVAQPAIGAGIEDAPGGADVTLRDEAGEDGDDGGTR